MANQATIDVSRRLREFLYTKWDSPWSEVSRKNTLQVLQRPKEHGWRAYLVGGLLRDLLTAKRFRLPRDFDVVVEGCSYDQLYSTFKDIVCGQNRFGGLHLKCSAESSEPGNFGCQIAFDIWRLEDTWAIKHGGFDQTIDAFVRTPFLNIDSIAVSISPDESSFEIFEHGFSEALADRCIEINYPDNPYPVLCASRAMILAAKLKFSLGKKLSSFICDVASHATPDDFFAAQNSHYRSTVYSNDQFAVWIQEIREKRYQDHDRVHLSPSHG